MYLVNITKDTGLWTLDYGRWTLDVGLWTLDYGPWTLDVGRWTLDVGLWTLDVGHWTLDVGLWTLDIGLKTEIMEDFIEKDNKLYAKFKFKDFAEAMVFINRVAEIAEKLNHHPTIINTYNIVELYLSTHDAGDVVTEKDWELANLVACNL